LRARKPRLMTACFHSQQCAEKYLKALLLTRTNEFPKTHDLIHLNDLCRANGILTEFSEAMLGELSLHAVASRYPGETPLWKKPAALWKLPKPCASLAASGWG